jgi:hypothetical protein
MQSAAESDPQVLDVFQERSSELRARFPDDYFELEKAVQAFDFDTALVVLARARREA